MSDSLWPHGLQHARLPCPSPTPRAYSNSCPLIRWCHPINSSFVILLSLPSIFPSIGVFSNESSSHQVAKVLELQLQDQSFQWIFRVDLLQDWLVWSFCNSRDSQESSPTAQFESINSLASDFMVQLSHPYIATGKNIALTIQTFVDKVKVRVVKAVVFPVIMCGC